MQAKNRPRLSYIFSLIQPGDIGKGLKLKTEKSVTTFHLGHPGKKNCFMLSLLISGKKSPVHPVSEFRGGSPERDGEALAGSSSMSSSRTVLLLSNQTF